MGGLLDIVSLGLNALPGVLNVFEAQRRRENPPQVGRPSGTREGSISFIGGQEPRGGFQVSPFINQQIQGLERQPGTIPGGLFNLFRVPNPAAGQVQAIQDQLSASGGRLSQAEVQDFAQQLRAIGQDDLASELVFQAGEQSGGTSIDPGIRELIAAGQRDVREAENLADRDFNRQLEALSILQGAQSLIPELRQSAQTQFAGALQSERQAENRAIRNLQGGRLEALLPLVEAQRIRQELSIRFDPEQAGVAAIESQRQALDVRHREETTALQSRLSNDPSFSGRPALIENEMRKLNFAQRNEMGTLQNGLRADFARISADIDLQTGAFVAQAAANTAAGLLGIRQMQAQANDVFQARRTQLNMSRIANDVNIGILEREGRLQQANFLRTMTELFVPEADLVRQAFAVNLQLEDRDLAFEQGTFQQTVGGFAQIGSAVEGFRAQKEAEDARKAAQEQGGGIGGILGSVASIGGLIAAPFTAGASLGIGGAFSAGANQIIGAPGLALGANLPL